MKPSGTNIIAVLVVAPLLMVALWLGAIWYADVMTGDRIAQSASTRVPYSHMAKRAGGGSASSSSRTLYMVYCAQCHGETGDGNGTRVLDRPARSFKDGGFSFGNTPEALFRTISNGIGGTPMPGYADTMSVADRRKLAEYVRGLGPPTLEVSTTDKVMVVGDIPVVVRGQLPSLGNGLPEHPRGLLIGSTDGLSFEYRADDLRLLAVRQGEFVERTDWTGRGGSPLKPLGRIVNLIDAGQPLPTVDLGEATSTRLLGTTIDGNRAILRYRVTSGNEPGSVEVEEWAEAASSEIGSGYRRHLTLVGLDQIEQPALRLAGSNLPHVAGIFKTSTSSQDTVWIVRQRNDGQYLLQGVTASFPIKKLDFKQDMTIPLARDPEAWVECTTFIVPEWNDQVEAALPAGGSR